MAKGSHQVITKPAGTNMRRRSHTPAVLSYLITFGFFAALGAILTGHVPEDSPPLMYMLSALQMAWAACMGFWFGATQADEQKNRLLAESAPPEKP